MAEWRRVKFETEQKTHRLEIDLLLKEARVCFGRAYFGVWWDFEDDVVYPLMFQADENAVDYGTEYGTGRNRYGEMKLHGEPINMGAPFYYTDSNGTWPLMVTAMDDLAAAA